MLETYFVKPQTVDRIRASWIGPEIERYVAWLAGQGYSARSVLRRVPLLAAFGEFARLNGARSVADLPGHVDGFVGKRVGESRDARRGMGQTLAKDIRGPVEQLLELVVPGFEAAGRPHHAIPFAGAVPGFFEYLTSERGLRPASVLSYRHHLDRFEAYLERVGVAGLGELSPALLSAFVAERSGAGLAKTTVREGCGVLRVFLRYAHREGARPRRSVEDGGMAAGLPALRHPPLDLLGRRRQGARRRRSPHAVREAGLRDLAPARDLRPSQPRGRGAHPRRHRLEARAAGHPRAQGRALDRLPAVGLGRRGARRLPPARPAEEPRPARLLPGGGAAAADRDRRRLQLRQALPAARPGSRSPARARTRCATPPSSDSWTPTSR